MHYAREPRGAQKIGCRTHHACAMAPAYISRDPLATKTPRSREVLPGVLRDRGLWRRGVHHCEKRSISFTRKLWAKRERHERGGDPWPEDAGLSGHLERRKCPQHEAEPGNHRSLRPGNEDQPPDGPAPAAERRVYQGVQRPDPCLRACHESRCCSAPTETGGHERGDQGAHSREGGTGEISRTHAEGPGPEPPVCRTPRPQTVKRKGRRGCSTHVSCHHHVVTNTYKNGEGLIICKILPLFRSLMQRTCAS